MKIEKVSIPIIDDKPVSGILARPDTFNKNSTTALVFAHGMANDMNHPSIGVPSASMRDLVFLE